MNLSEEYCSNCKRNIAVANYVIHSIHCKRNIVLCQRCKEPIPKVNMEEHLDVMHSVVACEKCFDVMEKWQLDDHEVSCSKNSIACKYCELEVPADELEEHTNFCGSRTETCLYCRKFVLIKEKESHLENCLHGVDLINSPWDISENTSHSHTSEDGFEQNGFPEEETYWKVQNACIMSARSIQTSPVGEKEIVCGQCNIKFPAVGIGNPDIHPDIHGCLDTKVCFKCQCQQLVRTMQSDDMSEPLPNLFGNSKYHVENKEMDIWKPNFKILESEVSAIVSSNLNKDINCGSLQDKESYQNSVKHTEGLEEESEASLSMGGKEIVCDQCNIKFPAVGIENPEIHGCLDNKLPLSCQFQQLVQKMQSDDMSEPVPNPFGNSKYHAENKEMGIWKPNFNFLESEVSVGGSSNLNRNINCGSLQDKESYQNSVKHTVGLEEKPEASLSMETPFVCTICGFMFADTDMECHFKMCSSSTLLCLFCSKLLCVEEIKWHLNDCLEYLRAFRNASCNENSGLYSRSLGIHENYKGTHGMVEAYDHQTKCKPIFHDDTENSLESQVYSRECRYCKSVCPIFGLNKHELICRNKKVVENKVLRPLCGENRHQSKSDSNDFSRESKRLAKPGVFEMEEVADCVLLIDQRNAEKNEKELHRSEVGRGKAFGNNSKRGEKQEKISSRVSKSKDQSELLPCEFCHEPFEADALILHQTLCGAHFFMGSTSKNEEQQLMQNNACKYAAVEKEMHLSGTRGPNGEMLLIAKAIGNELKQKIDCGQGIPNCKKEDKMESLNSSGGNTNHCYCAIGNIRDSHGEKETKHQDYSKMEKNCREKNSIKKNSQECALSSGKYDVLKYSCNVEGELRKDYRGARPKNSHREKFSNNITNQASICSNFKESSVPDNGLCSENVNRGRDLDNVHIKIENHKREASECKVKGNKSKKAQRKKNNK